MARSDEGTTCDCTVHIGQLFPGDTPILPEKLPEVVWVASVQAAQICLAYIDILRRGVGVQLLMPLLQEMLLYPLTMIGSSVNTVY